MSNRPDPERTKATILRVCLVLWLVGCIAMGVLAYVRHNHPDSPWAAWQAAARQAEQLHQQRLAQEQERMSEQRYIAWVQASCGPETWWKPRTDGALACTDKRGRSTGQVLVEAQP